MLSHHVSYLVIVGAAIVIFLLGGLWYSPLLFSKRWIALQGRTEEQMRADAARANMPLMYVAAFICALLIAWGIAILANSFVSAHFTSTLDWTLRGVKMGFFFWLWFVVPTSFATALFSMKPKQLWLIDIGYNLVSFMIAGAIMMGWMGTTH